jgi:predicted ABC-type ATPase
MFGHIDKKSLYIIAGCNGAGKTTASYTILPQILNCKEFVNADEIAKGISPFNSSTVSLTDGNLECIAQKLNKSEEISVKNQEKYKKLGDYYAKIRY